MEKVNAGRKKSLVELSLKLLYEVETVHVFMVADLSVNFSINSPKHVSFGL